LHAWGAPPRMDAREGAGKVPRSVNFTVGRAAATMRGEAEFASGSPNCVLDCTRGAGRRR
jgi:hypothetical protein